jgi:hypothetical protein
VIWRNLGGSARSLPRRAGFTPIPYGCANDIAAAERTSASALVNGLLDEMMQFQSQKSGSPHITVTRTFKVLVESKEDRERDQRWRPLDPFLAPVAFLLAVVARFLATFLAPVAFLLAVVARFLATFLAPATLFAMAFRAAPVRLSIRSAMSDLAIVAAASSKPSRAFDPPAAAAASRVPAASPTTSATRFSLFVMISG